MIDDRGVVSVVDLAGKKKVLSTGWESEEGLAWSPNGSEVWFSATQAGLQRRIYAVDLVGQPAAGFPRPGWGDAAGYLFRWPGSDDPG